MVSKRGAMEKKKAMERQGGFRLTGYGVERQDYSVRSGYGVGLRFPEYY